MLTSNKDIKTNGIAAIRVESLTGLILNQTVKDNVYLGISSINHSEALHAVAMPMASGFISLSGYPFYGDQWWHHLLLSTNQINVILYCYGDVITVVLLAYQNAVWWHHLVSTNQSEVLVVLLMSSRFISLSESSMVTSSFLNQSRWSPDFPDGVIMVHQPMEMRSCDLDN